MIPYPDVRETLASLRARGHNLAVVTNAPYFQANHRLNLLRLSEYFDGIVAWEGWSLEELSGPHDKAYVPIQDAPFMMGWRELLPIALIKPGVAPYLIAADRLGVPVEDTLIVGDSIRNDIAPGNKVGASTVWATYGTLADSDDLALLLRVARAD